MIPANGVAGVLRPMHTLVEHISMREQMPMQDTIVVMKVK
jgi:hypothetical protein